MRNYVTELPSNERCEECGGKFSRPGLFGCEVKQHPKPDTSQKIAAAIEADICDRRGLRQEFEGLDDDTQDEIRDVWAKLIKRHIG